MSTKTDPLQTERSISNGLRVHNRRLRSRIRDLYAENRRLREVLHEIATRPTVERNPDGEDQAAWSMQLIARDALSDDREGR